ncbi:hypothetical protein GCM10022403_088370 [Streptomyces coacervatus]|uniref:Uncharacterized protein n=1 Tax=Streptomyces coacervatus TaxID=647381 RepID=A0ABP7JET5_9ACTN
MDRGEEGRAAGGQGDAECAVVGGVEAGFTHPTAQQVLDGRGLGCGARVGVLEEIGGGVAQTLGRGGFALLRSPRLLRNPARS